MNIMNVLWYIMNNICLLKSLLSGNINDTELTGELDNE